MHTPVYLDYAATTPVDPRVVEVMVDCLRSPDAFGNPSAETHEPGRAARVRVERAREELAGLINATPEEIIWTSGATESDNLAIIGGAHFRRNRGHHLVTAATEHKAVLESCRHLEANGYRVTYLEPDHDGLIVPEAVEAAIGSGTILVSIMHINNETGVIQDITAIGRLCRRHDVLFHVDAAQSAGRLPVDVRSQSVDLLSLSAHKSYGPKGVGALFLDRERIRRVEPLLHGGGQERGLRPGTVPTHQVAGMGRAFAIAGENLVAESRRVAALRNRLWRMIQGVPGVILNGHPQRRACHILNVSVQGIEGESLLYGLQGLAVASGSACTAASREPSYVLRSLGRPDALAQSSIRFSLGRFTTGEEVDFAAEIFAETVRRLRELAPECCRNPAPGWLQERSA